MVTKRPGLIKFARMERTVVGDDIQVGHTAPDFVVQKFDWSLRKAFRGAKLWKSSGGPKKPRWISSIV